VRDALEWRTQIGAGDTSTDFEDCSSGSDCLNPYAQQSLSTRNESLSG